MVQKINVVMSDESGLIIKTCCVAVVFLETTAGKTLKLLQADFTFLSHLGCDIHCHCCIGLLTAHKVQCILYAVLYSYGFLQYQHQFIQLTLAATLHLNIKEMVKYFGKYYKLLSCGKGSIPLSVL